MAGAIDVDPGSRHLFTAPWEPVIERTRRSSGAAGVGRSIRRCTGARPEQPGPGWALDHDIGLVPGAGTTRFSVPTPMAPSSRRAWNSGGDMRGCDRWS